MPTPRPADVAAMLRPGNGAMAALAVLVGAAVGNPIWADDPPFPRATVAWAMLAAFLVAGFGNALDDILDRRVDARAHPWRPLPAGRVTVRFAAGLCIGLLGAGLAAAWLAGPRMLLLWAATNALVLGLYARWLKAVPAVGNAAVALVVASTFLFGASATGEWEAHREWGSLWGLAAMAALANFARENAKSLEDAPHDEGRRTLAQLWPAGSRGLVAAATVAACALAAWMALEPASPWWLARPLAWEGVGRPAEDPWFALWRLGVVLSLPVFLLGMGLVFQDARRSQKALKLAMAVALLGYAWGALFAGQAD